MNIHHRATGRKFFVEECPIDGEFSGLHEKLHRASVIAREHASLEDGVVIQARFNSRTGSWYTSGLAHTRAGRSPLSGIVKVNGTTSDARALLEKLGFDFTE